MKPFNLERAKAGAPVQTREGRPVRMLAFDIKSDDYPLAGVVSGPDEEYVMSYTEDGRFYSPNYDDHRNDLVMAPVLRTVWIPLYESKMTGVGVIPGGAYATLEEARAASKLTKYPVDVYPIVIEE